MRFKIFLGLKRLQQNLLRSETLRLGFAGLAAFVWWCVFYPELCFPQDTYEVVYEIQEAEDEMQEAVEDSLAVTDQSEEVEQTDSYSLLQAEGDQIVVRSRLLEWIKQHMD